MVIEIGFISGAVDMAGTQFWNTSALSTLLTHSGGIEEYTFEKPNQRITSRTTIQPQGNRSILRIFPSLEEPEERVGSWRKVNITRIRLDTGSRLTDAFFSWLLVADGDVVGCFDGLDSGRVLGQLSSAHKTRLFCRMGDTGRSQ